MKYVSAFLEVATKKEEKRRMMTFPSVCMMAGLAAEQLYRDGAGSAVTVKFSWHQGDGIVTLLAQAEEREDT